MSGIRRLGRDVEETAEAETREYRSSLLLWDTRLRDRTCRVSLHHPINL